VAAERGLYDTCLGGAAAQQVKRLAGETADLLGRAERAEAASGPNDPVARMALARLALTLDDVLALGDGEEARGARLSVLRQAASRAAAVAAWVPEAPGPHRLLGCIRARQAELEGMEARWELAIEGVETARRLDPEDESLLEMLWVLNLRAGRWEEAREWEARLESVPGTCRGE
jgi:hypothetical protein